MTEGRFLDVVLADPTVAAVLDRVPALGVRLAPRAVCEAKAARWRSVWPELTVLPWP